MSCEQIHALANCLQILRFPFNEAEIPQNGLYILFEKGEFAHRGNRIVRIGTHTGPNQLRSRLKQHFIKENKDRSIFRKNIGRAILNKERDPFLSEWELDLTTRKAKEKYSSIVDAKKQAVTEKRVSSYIQDSFSFVVIEIDEKEDRLRFESRIISTVSLCKECRPSKYWLGLDSPKKRIRESGLWQVNELYKQPLVEEELYTLKGLAFN